MYRKIGNFGSNRSLSNNPFSYCLVDSIDNKFDHAPVGDLYGPDSKNCQVFMAEHCSKNWDEACEIYEKGNTKRAYPNDARMIKDTSGLLVGMPLGKTLIGSAAERRFCKFNGWQEVNQPFDPTVADSPWIRWYEDPDAGSTVQQNPPVCSVNPRVADNDIVLNKLLDEPETGSDVLRNICRTSVASNIDLSGTRIGKFCDNWYRAHPNELLQAKQLAPQRQAARNQRRRR